ncbi:ABC transporter permease [candidate division FCPU426 bacterium]|nr:ABC transporter permease [candidate division FCPU426 bacterium]
MRDLAEKFKAAFQAVGDYCLFTVEACISIFRRPPHIKDLIEQMDAIGVQSLVILITTGLFGGMALSLFLEAEMALFGSKAYAGRALAVAAVRELGPIISGLMLAGRVGSRIASELGSMRVTQQIDSIEGLGQDPQQKLVTPRLLGLMLMTPPCTMVTNLMILLGGFLVSTVAPGTFWFEARKAFVPMHLAGGLIKPFVFGFIIATISCFMGLRASQGVRGVGMASANAVVVSSVVIFLANYIIGFIVLDWLGV